MQLIAISDMGKGWQKLSQKRGDRKIFNCVNLYSTIKAESEQWIKEKGDVPTGCCALTSAGLMKDCKFVIHAVGPIWDKVSIKLL